MFLSLPLPLKAMRKCPPVRIKKKKDLAASYCHQCEMIIILAFKNAIAASSNILQENIFLNNNNWKVFMTTISCIFAI